ncbi:MAG: ATP synthase F1 subunit delta [Lachnospiraceae bacterium]|nr:ATP synthase F1 subunit delta [Lachnospiraceae bacterium]
MAKLVSKTYGEALFELAHEENKASEMLEEIQSVREILKSNPEFTKMMLHPGISKQDKLRTVDEVFKGRASDELTGFIRIIVDKERFREIDHIFQYFIDKEKESQGIGVAYITTPKPLDLDGRSMVRDKLLETTDYKTIEYNYIVDPELIGGMVIRIGDRVVDSSIKSRLNDLTKELLELQLG